MFILPFCQKSLVACYIAKKLRYTEVNTYKLSMAKLKEQSQSPLCFLPQISINIDLSGWVLMQRDNSQSFKSKKVKQNLDCSIQQSKHRHNILPDREKNSALYISSPKLPARQDNVAATCFAWVSANVAGWVSKFQCSKKKSLI